LDARAAEGGPRSSIAPAQERCWGCACWPGLLTAFVLAEIAYQVIDGARPAISHFGLHFLAKPRMGAELLQSRRRDGAVRYGREGALMALVLATAARDRDRDLPGDAGSAFCPRESWDRWWRCSPAIPKRGAGALGA